MDKQSEYKNLGENLPAYMTPEQTWTLLGIGRSSFYELVRRGELPGASRLGKLVRVNTAQLLAGLGVKGDGYGDARGISGER